MSIKRINAQDLYEHMKSALTFFGIPWGEKNRMGVELSENKIEFICGQKSLIYYTDGLSPTIGLGTELPKAMPTDNEADAQQNTKPKALSSNTRLARMMKDVYRAIPYRSIDKESNSIVKAILIAVVNEMQRRDVANANNETKELCPFCKMQEPDHGRDCPSEVDGDWTQ